MVVIGEKISKDVALNCCKGLHNMGGWHWNRFHSCNAYTTYDYVSFTINDKGETRNLQPIRSYYTIVGFADISCGVVYEIGKYSVTTSKQFTQICNQIYKGYERVLYK